MEDPSLELEWEIISYSPPLEDEESEKSELGLGWRILSTGLSLGKNLLITGVAISSVPLVLPPIAVISALGFAFSVPFGVVFASYACSEKLMSKLLPPPPLQYSPMMDYENTLPEEEDEELVVAIENEEKEQREGMQGEIEMRIELVDNAGGDDGGPKEGIRDERESLSNRDEFTNKVSYLEVEDDEFLNNAKVGEINEEEREQNFLEPSKDEKPSLNVVGPDAGAGDNATKIDDYGEVAPEMRSTGDRENEGQTNAAGSLGNEGKSSGPILEVQTDNFVGNGGEKNVANREEREMTLTGIRETEKDKERQTFSKGKRSSKKMERPEKKKIFTTLKVFPGKRKEPEGDVRCRKSSGKDTDLPEQAKTSLENNLEEKQYAEVVVQESSRDLDNNEILAESDHNILLNDDVGNADSSVQKEEKPVGLKETWKGQNVENDVVSGVHCEMNKETNKNVTAEDVFADDGCIDGKIEQQIVMVYNDPGEMIADGGESSLEAAALIDVSELKYDEEVPELKEEKDASSVYSGLHSDDEGGMLSDEKIWKKIDAIRVIVGFKVPRRPSYFEELKALYVFTGIEPPSLSADLSDLTEFDNKLCFLMSVMGLK